MAFSCLISITNNGATNSKLFTNKNVLSSMQLINQYINNKIEWDQREINLKSDHISMESFITIYNYQECIMNYNTNSCNIYTTPDENGLKSLAVTCDYVGLNKNSKFFLLRLAQCQATTEQCIIHRGESPLFHYRSQINEHLSLRPYMKSKLVHPPEYSHEYINTYLKSQEIYWMYEGPILFHIVDLLGIGQTIIELDVLEHSVQSSNYWDENKLTQVLKRLEDKGFIKWYMNEEYDELIDITPILKFVSITVLLQMACCVHRYYSEICNQYEKRYNNRSGALEIWLLMKVGETIPNFSENRFVKDQKQVKWIRQLIDNQFYNIKRNNVAQSSNKTVTSATEEYDGLDKDKDIVIDNISGNSDNKM